MEEIEDNCGWFKSLRTYSNVNILLNNLNINPLANLSAFYTDNWYSYGRWVLAATSLIFFCKESEMHVLHHGR